MKCIILYSCISLFYYGKLLDIPLVFISSIILYSYISHFLILLWKTPDHMLSWDSCTGFENMLINVQLPVHILSWLFNFKLLIWLQASCRIDTDLDPNGAGDNEEIHKCLVTASSTTDLDPNAGGEKEEMHKSLVTANSATVHLLPGFTLLQPETNLNEPVTNWLSRDPKFHQHLYNFMWRRSHPVLSRFVKIF